MKKHIYEYDEIVVGSGLAAIFYSYINQLPLIFKEQNPPHFYERFEADFPLEKILLTNFGRFFNTPSGTIEAGTSKLQIYNRLLFVLGTSGLIPFSDKINKIRLSEGLLKITTSRAAAIYVKYNKLRVFNAADLEGKFHTKRNKKKRRVHDWFKIKTQEHNFDLINVDEEFVNKIYFVKEQNIKKVLVVSNLSEKELLSFDYSIVPMKYKLKEIFIKNNIKKPQRGFVLEHLRREVYNCDIIELNSKNNIIFDNNTEEQICQDILQSIRRTTHLALLDVYPWRLNHLLLDSSGTIR